MTISQQSSAVTSGDTLRASDHNKLVADVADLLVATRNANVVADYASASDTGKTTFTETNNGDTYVSVVVNDPYDRPWKVKTTRNGSSPETQTIRYTAVGLLADVTVS